MKDHKVYFILLTSILVFLSFHERITKFFLENIVEKLDVSHNIWLDILNLCLVVYMGVCVWKTFGNLQYRLSTKHLATIIFLLFLYVYYRCFDETFSFIGYFDSRFDYCLSCIIVLLGTSFIRFVYLKNHQEVFQEPLIDNVSKQETESDQIRQKLLFENPILEKVDDRFGFFDDAEELMTEIQLLDTTQRSFSIGIVGNWGSGKTSYLNLLKNIIGRYPTRYDLIEYSVRSSSDIKQIQTDFLSAFCYMLKKYDSGFSTLFKDYAHALNLVKNDNLLSKLFSLMWHDDIERSKENIEKVLKRINRTIIVLIDDMDRLTGKEILEVLKLVNKNASFPNTIFITAYDKKYVNNVLQSYLNVNHGSFYSDKYFNIEHTLPNCRNKQLLNYLENRLLKLCEKGEIKVGTAVIKSAMTDISAHFVSIFTTIRDVKRFYNMFILDYIPIQDDVYFYDFCVISIIKYKDKDLYRKLLNRENILELPDANSYNYYYMFSKSQNLSITEKLLSTIFPFSTSEDSTFTNDYRRICKITSFDNYFYREGQHKELMQILDVNAPFQSSYNKINAIKYSGITDELDTFLLYIPEYLLNTKIIFKRYIQVLIYITHLEDTASLSTKLNEIFDAKGYDNYANKYDFLSSKAYFSFLEECIWEMGDMSFSTSLMNKLLRRFSPFKNVGEIFEEKDVLDFNILRLEKYLSETSLAEKTPDKIFKMYEGCVFEGKHEYKGRELLKKHMMANPSFYASRLITHEVLKTGKIKLKFSFPFVVLFNDFLEFDLFLKKMDADNSIEFHIKETIHLFWNLFNESLVTSSILIFGDIGPDKVTEGDYTFYYGLLKKAEKKLHAGKYSLNSDVG